MHAAAMTPRLCDYVQGSRGRAVLHAPALSLAQYAPLSVSQPLMLDESACISPPSPAGCFRKLAKERPARRKKSGAPVNRRVVWCR